ncbi:MAG: hypothetical protein GY769_11940 [bacterium]|nr:hypothetical protein [bacterium]
MKSLRRSEGFSLIEVLVASFFLLIVLLGVVPIFTRSTVTNQMAYDNTRAAAFARSEMENYFQAPFSDPTGAPVPVMDVPSGSGELVNDQYFDPATHTWEDAPAPAGTSYLWSKTVTVRQFHISAIDDEVLDETEALQGTAHVGNVHLKQVLIEVQRGGQSSLLGPARTITLNTIRSN